MFYAQSKSLSSSSSPYRVITCSILCFFRQFQEYFGIKGTGRINKKTVKVMREPRCAIPDVGHDDPYSPLRQFHFYKYCKSFVSDVNDVRHVLCFLLTNSLR